jgi:response regulator RpfG family c-di-GMP phosphodiesterase
MPGRDGLWLIGELRKRCPDTAVIMATGVQDVGTAVTSLRHGVIDYLMKPFGRERLREAVRRGLEWHRAALAGRESQQRLHEEVAQRRHQLTFALNALPIDSRPTLEAMLGMLAIHDPALLEHGRRVARLASAIACEMDRPRGECEALELAALVHDLPKLTFPESIARKNGSLLPQERELIRVGPTYGRDVLNGIPFLGGAADIVHARYEWWDGSGYPRGLAGEAIPLSSRVLAVADTFDTLLQSRRHRPAMSLPQAIGEILRCQGSQFDPAVVDAFQRVQPGCIPVTAA